VATATLESDGSILRITGGSVGDPVTWDDVWNWDDGGGSSSGNGDVPLDGGGTAKVNTFMTEILADAIYTIQADIWFGNNLGDTTVFSSQNEMVYFDGIFTVKYIADLYLGRLEDDYGVDGSFWSVCPSANFYMADYDGVANIYASRIRIRAPYEMQVDSSAIDIRNSVIDSTGNTGGSLCIKNSMYSIIIRYLYSCSVSDFQIRMDPDTCEFVHVHYSTSGLKGNVSSGVLDVPNLKSTSNTYDALKDGAGDGLVLLDSDPAVDTVQIGSADKYIRSDFTCSIHVVDPSGNDLEDVSVLCEDQYGTEVFNVSTNASGVITEQDIPYKRWVGTSEVLTTYSPHKFTLSKPGYRPLVIDGVTADNPIDWELTLLEDQHNFQRTW